MTTQTKYPPHNIDAEESVIGSLLIDGGCIRLLNLSSADFYSGRNSFIYSACQNLRVRQEGINQITIAQELNRIGKLESSGGAAYLSHLISICPTSLDAEHYAGIVKALSVNRQMIKLAGEISTLGYSEDTDSRKLISQMNTLSQDFTRNHLKFDNLVNPRQAGGKVFDLIEKYNKPNHSLSYGFRDIDEITSGISVTSPEYIVIGARPSVGKTEFMLEVALHLAKQDKSILFASVEMKAEGLLERQTAQALRISVKELRRSGVPEKLTGDVSDLAARISEQKIYYLERGSTSQDIYNEASKLKDTVGLDIVFVDYLQHLEDCWSENKDSQVTRVGRASRKLVSIKKDLGVPVIAASQLSRASEIRTDKFPVLSDLRESGNIEQDADVVFLLHRAKDADDNGNPLILQVGMAKNRQLGWAKTQKLMWLEDKFRYGDISGYI